MFLIWPNLLLALVSILLGPPTIRRRALRLIRSFLSLFQSRPPPRLPNELLSEIFLALEDHKPTLLALCVCSKRFHALAEPVLYRTARATIRVGTCTSHLHSGALLSKLLQAPTLALSVTALELALESDLSTPPPKRPLLLPSLPVLPNLRVLRILYKPKYHWCSTANWIQLFNALGPSVPQLVELDLREAGFTLVQSSRLFYTHAHPLLYRSLRATIVCGVRRRDAALEQAFHTLDTHSNLARLVETLELTVQSTKVGGQRAGLAKSRIPALPNLRTAILRRSPSSKWTKDDPLRSVLSALGSSAPHLTILDLSSVNLGNDWWRFSQLLWDDEFWWSAFRELEEVGVGRRTWMVWKQCTLARAFERRKIRIVQV
ncbi:Proteophosphoglycan ppg4 [Rhodotorula toruloides]|nr:Proteophosphoglycan ppg4 [Rhodotorula toruloides]